MRGRAPGRGDCVSAGGLEDLRDATFLGGVQHLRDAINPGEVTPAHRLWSRVLRSPA